MDDFTSLLTNKMSNLKYNFIMENPTHILEFKSSYCGDRSKLFIRVVDNYIVDASYEQLGCSLNCIVFEEIISQFLGKPLSFLESLSKEELSFNNLVPSKKKHCVNLCFDTITKGLNN